MNAQSRDVFDMKMVKCHQHVCGSERDTRLSENYLFLCCRHLVDQKTEFVNTTDQGNRVHQKVTTEYITELQLMSKFYTRKYLLYIKFQTPRVYQYQVTKTAGNKTSFSFVLTDWPIAGKNSIFDNIYTIFILVPFN